MSWFDRMFRRQRLYDELSEELREHIEEKTEQLMRIEGLSRSEARQAALRAFGNLTLLEEKSRVVWQWSTLESIFADLKLTLRRLRRAPGFAVIVLLTLAIGIGANTAVFSVINSVLLKPLPYPGSNQLLGLRLDAPGAGGLASISNGLAVSPSMYLTFAEHNRSFQSIGLWSPSTANVTGIEQPEWVQADQVSDGVLQTLEVPPLLGRWFTPADQDPHGSKTAMLSYGYWQRRFGGDRSVIGRAIQVDAQTRTIVGVMPRGFRMVDNDFDLLIPMAIDRSKLKLAPFCCNGIGRLKPGVSIAQANADIARLIPLWMDSWSNGPGTDPHWYEHWKIAPNFRLLKSQVIGDIGNVLWVVMATIGIVLLIVCMNVANLLLVRAESRHQELSIRAALGAGRARIARELLVESVVLGLIGGALGVGVAAAGLRLLVSIGPANLPRLSEVSLDARSIAFTFVISLLSGLLFGSLPVWKYVFLRGSARLSGSGRTASQSRERHRARNILVVIQVAMALVLLVCALLMVRTFAALHNVDPGFADAPHIQTVSTWIPDQLITDEQTVTRIENNIIDKFSAIPGVTSAGFARAVPMDGNEPNWDNLFVQGKNYEGNNPPLRFFNYVSPSYFNAMGTRFVAGRDFTWTDIYNLNHAVIVSENFARETWGSASAAIGKQVRQSSDTPWQDVIGVVEDVHVRGVDEEAPATIYWPTMLRSPYEPKAPITASRFITFAVRSDRAGTASLLSEMQQAVSSVNANLPLASVQTMQEIYSKSLARTSFTLVMLGIAAAMALALGIIGIYGVISYAVSQRTREIGIRLALGAQKRELRWMFVRSALVLTGVGVFVGLGAAVAVAQLIRTLLFGVSPLDPLSFVVVPVILVLAAAFASFLPASRVTTVNPVDALRAE
ncbi:ABC transporter permease [Edaphobacter albus]|uniref:ABC transporter permease n=1 Tax=Edaphobacter sp. 4G125 TaxID=2763071 RepID=UPI0016478F03|nr:ABC transporter permease [Edaphobacter sp. 4G125]QNI36197.1 ABC transporter permease [Edaphobacter sp. 4G125]